MDKCVVKWVGKQGWSHIANRFCELLNPFGEVISRWLLEVKTNTSFDSNFENVSYRNNNISITHVIYIHN